MRSGLLALLGVVLIVVGVGMVSVPVATITAGVSAVVAAYVVRYLEVKRDEDA